MLSFCGVLFVGFNSNRINSGRSYIDEIIAETESFNSNRINSGPSGRSQYGAKGGVSIPTGSIQGRTRPPRTRRTESFNSNRINSGGDPPCLKASQPVVSIPTGSIQGQLRRIESRGIQKVSIPTGSIQGGPACGMPHDVGCVI